MSKIITRFAPSPTGYLHIGNIRTALVCYLYAKKQGGSFILRIDDTDTERSRQEYVDAIKADLSWLGLDSDSIYFQSERIDKYEQAKQNLIDIGRLYECYETPEELEIKRKMQLKLGRPPIYDRAGLKLSEEDKNKYKAEGRKPHYRFLLSEGNIKWNDLVRGEVEFDAKNLADPILVRGDGSFTYMLPSTVDDAEMEISHVVRGEDHLTNTAIQIQLFEAIGAKSVEFAHLSLIKAKEGKISKREGGFSVKELQENGVEPVTVVSFLARIGTSENVEPFKSLEEITTQFDLAKFSKSPTQYDTTELERLNEKIIHQISYDQVKERFPEIDEQFWNAVKPNLKRLNEVKEWWMICHSEIAPIIDEPEFASKAAELLPSNEWDESTWKIWTGKIKEETGRGGKSLFMPIRKALTGKESGPELQNLLPLIGREKVTERLKGKTA